MKLRVLTLLGVLALGAGTVIHAQDYDDIYYDGNKTATEVKKETKRVETRTTRTEVPTRYKVTVEKNYQTDRDVDEYNRRGGIYAQPENDTLYLDAPDYESQGTFGNTQRIERFYNPDIVVLSNDDELVELYYDNAPTVNLVIGSNYGFSPRFGWGFGYSSYWYDPWYSLYDPFWDPWYYSGWYGWHRPYYSWGGWYSPWHYSSWSWGWGWHGGWHGWYDPWARPWGHHGPHMWSYGNIYHNTGNRYWHRDNRLPGDHRSLLSGSSRRGSGFSSGGTRSGVRTAGNTTRTGSGTINNGRTRPSTMSGVTTGRTRPSSQVGNIGRGTNGSVGTTSGYSGGSVRNRGTASSGYSGSTTRIYSPSTTRSSSYSGSSRSGSSYSGSSRSSSSYGSSHSSSYGSSRSSGSSYSGSTRSSGSFGGGGGFGGGSSRSGGGGGGGGRRH